jgi:hypothetical protein
MNAGRPDPASPRQPRPWQYSLLEAAIVVTAVCVWLGVWRFGGTIWALISMLFSGPLIGLGLVDYGLRHKSETAQWLGRGVLYLWPLVLVLLLLQWFGPR